MKEAFSPIHRVKTILLLVLCLAAAVGAADDAKPWYWSLPPRARDAVGQSLEGRFPPKYSSAIERYYERLAKRQRAFRPTGE